MEWNKDEYQKLLTLTVGIKITGVSTRE